LSAIFDDFDVVVQLRQSSIRDIVKAQHAGEIFFHSYTNQHRGRRIDLIINRPTVQLLPGPHGDNIERATLIGRVFYHSRRASDLSDVGLGAVADVTIRLKLTISTGDPANLSGVPKLVIDWQETTRNDIIVHGVSAEMTAEVKDALLHFITVDGGGSYTIPPIGSSSDRVGSLSFKFLNSNEPVLTVGMNVGNVIKGSKTGMQQVILHKKRDWALALSRNYVVNMIEQSVLDSIGGLPYRISKRCTVRIFGGCANHQIVKLTELSAFLWFGYIIFYGHIHVRNTGFLIPDVNADFQVFVSLSVDIYQQIRIHVGEPHVGNVSFFGDLVNFFSGGVITNAIRNGVKNAFQSQSFGQISEFMSPSFLSGLASADTPINLNIFPSAKDIRVYPYGIIIQGTLAVDETDKPPIASYETHRFGNMLSDTIYDARTSWAPGGWLREFRWDFSDGSSQITRDRGIRFVIKKRISEIRLIPRSIINQIFKITCLTVQDDKYRKATTCGVGSPPHLVIIPIPWLVSGPTTSGRYVQNIKPIAEPHVVTTEKKTDLYKLP